MWGFSRDQDILRTIVEDYLAWFPDSPARDAFRVHADTCPDPFSRTSLAGHVTGSALVLARDYRTGPALFQRQIQSLGLFCRWPY
ncbi:MAG: hypothetical protein M3O22_07460 [Pseudomonadota bacterium]|nr:hypothetical protein [Pseudomonadota bacterium]